MLSHLFFLLLSLINQTKNTHKIKMRNILVIGAGRSCSSLIQYLLEKSSSEQLFITVADISLENARELVGHHPNSGAVQFDVFDEEQRQTEIEKADIVISMLPARFHINVAKDCLRIGRHIRYLLLRHLL